MVNAGNSDPAASGVARLNRQYQILNVQVPIIRPVAVAIIVLAIGAVKVADMAASVRHIYLGSRSGGDVDWDWTPVFAWAERTRKGLELRGRGKGKRALVLTVLIDTLFRAPVLATVLGAAVLLVVGTVHGTAGTAGCAFPSTASGVGGWLNVAAAAMAVLVGMPSVLSLLQMIATGDADPRRSAGQFLDRSHGGSNRKLLDPVIVALGTIVSFFVAFAALYGSLIAMHGSWVAASPCELGPLDLVYFSASVGATVGFGDISPASSALRAVTTVQILLFFAVLALYLQALWVNPRRSGNGK